MRKFTPLAVLLVLSLALAHSPSSAAQDNGQSDEAAGILQLFGEGNGISGVVTASEPGNFTIRADDGQSYKVFWSANTRFMKDRQPIEANEIRMGDTLVAAGLVDRKAKTVGAVFLFEVDAEEANKARAEFGKTWVAGRVTVIRNLHITIKRADDQKPEIVAVDENTSFRRRRESITLADVKTGDFISVEGAAHGDTFLASVLRVMKPDSGPNSKGPGAGSPDF